MLSTLKPHELGKVVVIFSDMTNKTLNHFNIYVVFWPNTELSVFLLTITSVRKKILFLCFILSQITM